MRKVILIPVLIFFVNALGYGQATFDTFEQVGDTTFESITVKTKILNFGNPQYTLRIWSEWLYLSDGVTNAIDTTLFIDQFGSFTTTITFPIPIQYSGNNQLLHAKTVQQGNNVIVEQEISNWFEIRVPSPILIMEQSADTIGIGTNFYANLNANVYNYDRLGGTALWEVYNDNNAVVFDTTITYPEILGPVWTSPAPIPLTIDITDWPEGVYGSTITAWSIYLIGQSDTLYFTRPAIVIDTTDTIGTPIVEQSALKIMYGPNPLTEELSIHIPYPNSTIILTNAVGQRMAAVFIEKPKSIRLQTQHYAPGVYFLTVISDNKTQTLRLIK